MSRARAARLIPNASCALVSISTPARSYDVSPRGKGWAGVLRLEFHDVANEVPPDDWLDTYVRFTSAHAGRVCVFAHGAISAGIEDLVIHCDAGLSRSVAIAESLRRAGLADLKLWECTAPLQANDLVLRRMSTALPEAMEAAKELDPFWR